VHIEQLSPDTRLVLERREINTGSGLYNELCNADETEEEAYQHFMTESLETECDSNKTDIKGKQRTPFFNPATNCDVGVGYYTPSWTTRHSVCAREPNPRRIRLELEAWLNRPTLLLSLLLASRQIHHEARLLPYRKNIFAFGSARAFQVFALSRKRSQLRALQHLNITVCIGTAPFSEARARDWVQALAWRSISSQISSLRTLHLSVETYSTSSDLSLSPTSLSKPSFDDFYQELVGPDQRLRTWMKELAAICRTPECRVTVMVADDPLSPWGPIGKSLYCSDTKIREDEWMRRRRRACLTEAEKREFGAEIGRLLKLGEEEWDVVIEGLQIAR
jgi:hypothetical protein